MNTPSFIGFILGITGIVILLFLGRKTKDPYWKCVWRSSLLFCSMYILILIVMAVNAQYLSFQLEAMDVNGNGQIDLNEYTEEYRVVRDRLLKDPDRNNAFYTGAILSFVMALIALSIDLFTTYFQSRTNSIKI
ncbi:hypothetical protein D1013_17410 [Euzebyella marina]|uniref:EF-hand domain-containing protein n=1 Tax=Euzebyella marina TaxID=1761453 RepID=A0A3G2L9T7_9FLAO|nr:hypothetical protein [Euzebyella marina]AYN69032.1 hypothetical protein D1013_17410 [Euzebyella marina]